MAVDNSSAQKKLEVNRTDSSGRLMLDRILSKAHNKDALRLESEVDFALHESRKD
jgi:hypothetical protein